MLNLLEKFLQDKNDTAYALAHELSRELRLTFAYVLDKTDKDFCPEFLVASFLSPEYKWMVKPTHMPAIRTYLEGNKFILCKVRFRICKCLLIEMVSGGDSDADDHSENLVFCLPGMECLQEEFTSSLNNVSTGRGKFILCKVHIETLQKINLRWSTHSRSCHLRQEGCNLPCSIQEGCRRGCQR